MQVQHGTCRAEASGGSTGQLRTAEQYAELQHLLQRKDHELESAAAEASALRKRLATTSEDDISSPRVPQVRHNIYLRVYGALCLGIGGCTDRTP